MIINLILVLISLVQQIQAEPTVSYNGSGTSVAEMEWFSGLFDQNQWNNHLGVLKNQTCKRNMEFYIGKLKNGSSWAAKMYDASGRYNGLFFMGNDFWLGSKVLCQELQNNEANIEVPPFVLSYFVAKIRLSLSPKFTTPVNRLIHLGLCLPNACSNEEIRKLLSKEARNKAIQMEIIDVRTVPGNYCLFKDLKFQIVGLSALITLLLILVASVVEVVVKKKISKSSPRDAEAIKNDSIDHSKSTERIITKESSKPTQNFFLSLLLSFSAITNGNKIMSVNHESKDAIGCLHGLRVVSIGWIILVHTYLNVFGVGRNKALRTITERKFMYQTISNATFSVDTFFFISGLLVTLGFFRHEATKSKKADKETLTRKIFSNIFSYLIMISYRLLRLTPAYLFVLGANEVTMRYIHSNSVFTPAIIDHITCDKFWWRNILYINNFFPQREFCMLWSWYIANDTQFFAIASILLMIAVKGPKQLKFSVLAIIVLLLSSWMVTFILAIQHNYVARVQEPFALFDELYDKPWMRIGPYLIGMVIGYIIFNINGQVIFTPAIVTIGWISSIVCLGSLVYGLGKQGLVIPVSAFYVALGHTAWGLSLAWITVACCTGYGGPFNLLFSCRLFLPLSRLTYCAYLVHPILMCITSFSLDGSLQIHNNLTVVIFFGNFLLSFLVAFIISLGFEAPVINLKKLIF
ncbi:unnamed protein product [Ceutorhynchus assimilis]|uniref:Nose resistant-to-fluoxetine protein N-terminal domain-containing protein n=1 Tax=Ceutorhynchus assimilis TaxID=467358 RepID=A0A9N9MIQ6_9CUCU|nr:unnamed protein product [Ceutorhynchus assimilis]